MHQSAREKAELLGNLRLCFLSSQAAFDELAATGARINSSQGQWPPNAEFPAVAASVAMTMKEYNAPAMHGVACRVLSSLGDVAIRRSQPPEACPQEVFDALVSSLTKYGDDGDVLPPCLSAVGLLAAAGGVQGKDRAGKAGLFAQLTRLLQRRGEDSEIDFGACHAAWYCSVSPSPPENSQRAVAAGFVPAVSAAAARWAAAVNARAGPSPGGGASATPSGNASPVMALSMALAAVQAVSYSNTTAKVQAGAAGLMATCALVLREFAIPPPSRGGGAASPLGDARLDAIGICESACGNIGNCCYDADEVTNARLAGEAGAAEALLRVAKEHAQNALLMHAVLRAMKGMTYKEARLGCQRTAFPESHRLPSGRLRCHAKGFLMPCTLLDAVCSDRPRLSCSRLPGTASALGERASPPRCQLSA